MSKNRMSRREALALSGLVLSGGCLNLQTESSTTTPGPSGASRTSSKPDSEPESTTTETEDQELGLTEEWQVSISEYDRGRHLYLADSAVILSGDGIYGLSHDDGSELFHAFSDHPSNDTSSSLSPPFTTVGNRLYAYGSGTTNEPWAIMAVNLDGSNQVVREVSNKPSDILSAAGSAMVHLPNMREHEVSADGATDFCSIGGGEIATVSPGLETTESVSLPDEMCKPRVQLLTPDEYIAKTNIYIRVIDRDSGDERWKKPLDTRELCIHDGTLYLPSLNDGLIALDIETGERVWEFQQDLGNLVIHDGTLYGAQLDTVAIDLATHETQWRGQKRGDPLGKPHIVDGIIVLPTTEAIYGYDAADGTLAYRSPLPESIQDPRAYRVQGHAASLYFKSDSVLRRYSLAAL